MYKIVFFSLFAIASASPVQKMTSIEKKEDFKIQRFENELILIPKDTFSFGISDYHAPFDYCRSGRMVMVDSFYICSHELSNKEYVFYLDQLSDSLLKKQALRDNNVWPKLLGRFYELMDSYFVYDFYSDYPVVGISYEQAVAYCDWLTTFYMSNPKRKFKKVRFRIPSEEEWVCAFLDSDGYRFPWKGDQMIDKKGNYLANFMIVDQFNIGRSYLNPTTISMDQKSQNLMAEGNKRTTECMIESIYAYKPNSKGIYNMSGNVEEYVSEKGISKGGSWADPGYYLQHFAYETYDSTSYTSAERGFRYVMEVLK